MTAGPQLYLKCEHCGNMFVHNGHKRRRWCSDKCKAAAWRAAQSITKSKTDVKNVECHDYYPITIIIVEVAHESKEEEKACNPSE